MSDEVSTILEGIGSGFGSRQAAYAARARAWDNLDTVYLALRATRFAEKVQTVQLNLLERMDDAVSELYGAMVALDGFDTAAIGE